MSYVPLQIPAHVSGAMRVDLFDNVVDPTLAEIHFLMTVQDPAQGPRGSLQLSLAKLLISAWDGAAQLFEPDPPGSKLGNGDRFRQFVKKNYPWSFDRLETPPSLTEEEICDVLWADVRNPLIHRYGITTQTLGFRPTKYGRLFAANDSRIEQIERDIAIRPTSEPAISRSSTRTIIWLEPFYWCLRMAITSSIDTMAKANEVEAWIRSGRWDHRRSPATGPSMAVLNPQVTATP